MEMYESLYHMRFNAATDALEAMKEQNYGLARAILVEVQQKAEEYYVEQGLSET